MVIKINNNGLKVKIKITSYDLYKLNISPEQLTNILKCFNGESKDDSALKGGLK